RLTYRYFIFPENTNSWEKEYFPLNVGNNQPLNFYNCPGNREYTSNFAWDSDDYNTTFRANYIPVGNSTAIDRCGGFVYFADFKHPRCETEFQKNFTIFSEFMMVDNLGAVTMDMGVFSIYFDFAMYFSVSIIR